MSLKLFLNLLITALMAVMLLGGTALTIRNAHEDIRAEVESTAGLAMHLIDKELMYFSNRQSPSRLETPFGLKSLGNVRHLRVEYFDVDGNLLDSNQLYASTSSQHPPPNWFVRLMSMLNTEIVSKRRPVYSNGQLMGEVVITADTSYEINEVWEATLSMLGLVAMFFITVNIMVYWAVGRALRPVDQILHAINAVEQGNLDTRLPSFHLPELKRISEKFNDMAHALQLSMQSNHKLSQQLIHLQEEERKMLARDLHDEIGQSLTAIQADAAAILNATADQPRIHNSAHAISQVARQVMTMVRSMLEKLRPESLDKLGLKVALEDLISAWQQRYSQIICKVQIADNLHTLNESVAIAAYRLVQESLTNVARHASARQVSITVWVEAAVLSLVMEDDGRGFVPEQATGFGLVGMRERIQSLGGELELHSEPGSGTYLMARLPLNGNLS